MMVFRSVLKFLRLRPIVHFQSMAVALGSGECSRRLSAPRTAWRILLLEPFLDLLDDGADDHAGRFLGALRNAAAERHERTHELNIGLNVAEHLRLKEQSA